VQEAAVRHASNPAENPVTLSMRVAQEQLDHWFARRLELENVPIERKSALGRVAFLACDGPARYPSAVLQADVLPAELEQRVRQWSGRAGPNLEVSNMAPRDMDFGLVTEVAEDTWEGLERRPVVRFLLLWAIFVLVLTALFFLSRP
jgi:hypothetical protein